MDVSYIVSKKPITTFRLTASSTLVNRARRRKYSSSLRPLLAEAQMMER